MQVHCGAVAKLTLGLTMNIVGEIWGGGVQGVSFK